MVYCYTMSLSEWPRHANTHMHLTVLWPGHEGAPLPTCIRQALSFCSKVLPPPSAQLSSDLQHHQTVKPGTLKMVYFFPVIGGDGWGKGTALNHSSGKDEQRCFLRRRFKSPRSLGACAIRNQYAASLLPPFCSFLKWQTIRVIVLVYMPARHK